jgi:Acetyltransferase (GNAT) domain
VSIQVINPLSDSRWDDLVARHPRASVFHQRGWLEALVCTYRYEPLALTTASAGEPLQDGIVFCLISSWITGTRLVSLPFSDHCEPLLKGPGDSTEFMSWLRAECDRQHWRYLELRPQHQVEAGAGHGLQSSRSYWLHELDTTSSVAQIFSRFHKNSFQRKIRRAEKERLTCETGCSEQLVDEFCGLLLITRRRHKLPPQPRKWFTSLAASMGDKVQIMLARKGGTPIAAILTLRHSSCIVYKYGCSDARFHSLGGMPFLFWRLVEDSKEAGVEKIDLGRCDLENEGLTAFKDRLGTTRKLMTYLRYPQTGNLELASSREWQVMSRICSVLPDSVMPTVGRLLYRHIG